MYQQRCTPWKPSSAEIDSPTQLGTRLGGCVLFVGYRLALDFLFGFKSCSLDIRGQLATRPSTSFIYLLPKYGS